MNINTDNKFMILALKEAQIAFEKNEVPVGAVIVKDDQVIAKAHNQPISTNNPVAHAEMIVIQKAGKFLQSSRLDECKIYITLQPCMMCMAALNLTKIKKMVYGAKQKYSNHSYLLENPNIEIIGGVLKKEAQLLLRNFFQTQREKKE